MDQSDTAIDVILQPKAKPADQCNQNQLDCLLLSNLAKKNQNINQFDRDNNSRSIHSTTGLGMTSKSTSRNQSNKLDRNNNFLSEAVGKEKNMALDENLRKMGWYWGSISPEYASKLLKDQQDGSFLIRDSSSECYIFSMTLKLDNEIHHTRIEHSNGYFSFGSTRRFHCTTMVDFIEQAIECSRNGDMSFFLHRGPEEMGPVEFRMIPLSRMNGSYPLKHLCRFAILPYVRKDKISELSLPESLRDYLHEPFRSAEYKIQET